MLANVNTQFGGNGTKLFSILKNGRMVSSPTMTRITMKSELMVTNTGGETPPLRCWQNPNKHNDTMVLDVCCWSIKIGHLALL